MHRFMRGGFVALAGLVFFSPFLSARIMAPAPIPDRIARADCVFVGKVTEIKGKTVTTKEHGELSVAVVKVQDAVLGTRGARTINVGFHAAANRRFPHLSLKPGQEALFFLKKEKGHDLFVHQYYFDIVPRQDNPQFAKDVALARRCVKLLEDPRAAFASKDAGERFLAAALLIKHYRTPRGSGKTVPADAAVSKQVLSVLAEADWQKYDANLRIAPPQLFNQLGLGPKDGFNRPQDPLQFIPAAKQWLRDNAGTYRIQRFTGDEDPSK